MHPAEPPREYQAIKMPPKGKKKKEQRIHATPIAPTHLLADVSLNFFRKP